MPCDRASHNHVWVTSGTLVIERCERFCMFCTGDNAAHRFGHAWFLRRHVRGVHGKEYPNLEVSEGWTKPNGTVAGVAKGSDATTPKSKTSKRANQQTTTEKATKKTSASNSAPVASNYAKAPTTPLANPQTSGLDLSPPSTPVGQLNDITGLDFSGTHPEDSEFSDLLTESFLQSGGFEDTFGYAGLFGDGVLGDGNLAQTISHPSAPFPAEEAVVS